MDRLENLREGIGVTDKNHETDDDSRDLFFWPLLLVMFVAGIAYFAYQSQPGSMVLFWAGAGLTLLAFYESGENGD